MRVPFLVAVVCWAGLAPSAVFAQWQMQTSNTTADLRGIDNVGGGVAWASGTHGTVLRTEDGGYVWQTCAVPPGAEKLDFRGVQAFDANTAIVMSSGPGDLSRLYKTTDGCHTWKLLFTNPDKDGFWDGIVANQESGLIIGDPVDEHFVVFSSTNTSLNKWVRHDGSGNSPLDTTIHDAPAYHGESLFAASNSSLKGSPNIGLLFVTGGVKSGPRSAFFVFGGWVDNGNEFGKISIPLAKGGTAGAFSFDCAGKSLLSRHVMCVAVGGDYHLPNSSNGTAAYSSRPDVRWRASKAPPHGYRSSVAYDADLKLWITVGPNGTDVSADDGKNWRAVRPDAALHEAADADRDWNAISLPFVVGPKGRIGRLEAGAVKRSGQ
ncbi:MAG: WD40/YVTN/BNR-like repeat-containing protein [Acidobacteriota bacterium]